MLCMLCMLCVLEFRLVQGRNKLGDAGAKALAEALTNCAAPSWQIWCRLPFACSLLYVCLPLNDMCPGHSIRELRLRSNGAPANQPTTVLLAGVAVESNDQKLKDELKEQRHVFSLDWKRYWK